MMSCNNVYMVMTSYCKQFGGSMYWQMVALKTANLPK